MRLQGLDDLFMDFGPLVREMNIGVDVWMLSLSREQAPHPRVTIYSPDGITLDHCAQVQKVLSGGSMCLTRPDAYDLRSRPRLERTLARQGLCSKALVSGEPVRACGW